MIKYQIVGGCQFYSVACFDNFFNKDSKNLSDKSNSGFGIPGLFFYKCWEREGP